MKPLPALCVTLAALGLLAGCGSSHKTRTHTAVKTPTTTTTASVTVPGVAGQSSAFAQATLSGVGLGASVSRRPSSTIPSGYAIGTKPAAAATATKGEVVILYVSTGPAPVKLPNVVGSSPTTAETKLTKLGLSVVLTELQQTGGAGKVSTQAPAAGSTLKRGTVVRLTVTTAPATVSVPLVTAKTEEEAVTTATALGLAITFQNQTVTDLAKDHVVLTQSPVAGTTVAKGSTLTLTVGVYKKPASG